MQRLRDRPTVVFHVFQAYTQLKNVCILVDSELQSTLFAVGHRHQDERSEQPGVLGEVRDGSRAVGWCTMTYP